MPLNQASQQRRNQVRSQVRQAATWKNKGKLGSAGAVYNPQNAPLYDQSGAPLYQSQQSSGGNQTYQDGPADGIPFSPGPEYDTSRALRDRDNALLALENERKALESDYGFGDTAANNPYARAVQLQRSLDIANRTSTNSYASAGQLYAGSLTNALGENRYQYGLNYDRLRKAYQAALQRNEQNRLGAGQDYQDVLLDDSRQAIQDNLGEDSPYYIGPENAPPPGPGKNPPKRQLPNVWRPVKPHAPLRPNKGRIGQGKK